jgi:hypothetical protein
MSEMLAVVVMVRVQVCSTELQMCTIRSRQSYGKRHYERE